MEMHPRIPARPSKNGNGESEVMMFYGLKLYGLTISRSQDPGLPASYRPSLALRKKHLVLLLGPLGSLDSLRKINARLVFLLPTMCQKVCGLAQPEVVFVFCVHGNSWLKVLSDNRAPEVAPSPDSSREGASHFSRGKGGNAFLYPSNNGWRVTIADVLRMGKLQGKECFAEADQVVAPLQRDLVEGKLCAGQFFLIVGLIISAKIEQGLDVLQIRFHDVLRSGFHNTYTIRPR